MRCVSGRCGWCWIISTSTGRSGRRSSRSPGSCRYCWLKPPDGENGLSRVFQALGLAVGLHLLYFLLRFPVTAPVHGRCMTYDSPHFYIVGVIVVYLLATCVSGLFSIRRCIKLSVCLRSSSPSPPTGS